MRMFYKFLLLSICFLVLGTSAQAEVVSVVPSPTTLGNEDNSTGWWGALTDDIKAEAGSTYQVAFTNYSDCKANWNNFVLVLRKGDTSLGADGEYAVLRADNYGWGSSYNDCLHKFKDDRNWDTWLAAMNGAKCAVRIYNHGDGFATVKMIMKGTNGVTYQQIYTNIKVDANDLCFAFTIENCHLNFTESTNEFDSLFDTQFFDAQLGTTLNLADIDYKITSITEHTSEVISCSSSLKGALNIRSAINIEGTTYSVTSIGSEAFQRRTGLTSIEIPNSVTSIGDYAFNGCTGLTAVTIPNSVTSIGSEAFFGCRGLTSIEIPNSVTSIGAGAFSYCLGLTSVTIPNSVTSIDNHAFWGCSGLTSMTVDSGNAYYDSRDNCNAIIETATNTLIAGCKNTIIPNSVTSIGFAAFQNCSGLTAVTIPNSVTSIGDYAFQQCTDLTSIEIPNSVTSIGKSAFYDCTGLTSVTIPNSVTSIGDYAFQQCTGLTSIEFPNSVTSIGVGALGFCTGLTSVKIPNSVTTIGHGAFDDCTGLSSMTVDSGNAYYDSRDNCNAIIETATNTLIAGCKNTIIPNSVTTIGLGAFAGCTGLTSVTIPNSVTTIGYGAFQYCTGLTKIKCLAQTPPTCGDDVFYNVPSTCVLEVPAGTKAAYAAAAGWSAFKLVEEIENLSLDGINYHITSVEDKTVEVTKLGENKYYQGDIIIPSSIVLNGITYRVTSIGEKAFFDCKELTSIEIPNSVTSIKNMTFYGCRELTSIEIPNSITTIGDYAFSACRELASIEIPNGVTSIGEGAFFECYGLTSIKISSSVTSIGHIAFGRALSLTSIVVTKDNPVFDSRENCNAIIETSSNTLIQGCNASVIPYGVTTIGKDAFESCENLTSIKIPNSVATIERAAFIGCTGLTSIEIPNSVISIESQAFHACNGLNSIVVEAGNPTYDSRGNCNAIIETSSNTLIQGCNTTVIPHNITSIGDYAFAQFSGITSIDIPSTVTSIGVAAFIDCYNIATIISRATVPPVCGDAALYTANMDCTIYVPAGTKAAYAAAAGWSAFTNIVEVDANTFAVDGIFYIVLSEDNKTVEVNNGKGLTGNVNIPSTVNYNGITYSVTSIGDYAFYGCSGLTSIEIPNSVTTIGESAFDGCSKLTSVEIPNSVTTIELDAFQGCSGLTSLKLSNNLQTIKSGAFSGCSGLTSLDLPNSLISLDGFSWCTGLTSVVIPNSVTTIGSSAFENCSGLVSIKIPNSVTTIESEAFWGCTALSSIELPKNLTSIEYGTFYCCTSLTSIEIPEDVTSIAMWAFYGCTGLTKIKCLAQTPPTCGDNVFYNIPTSTCVLEVPVGTKAAYAAAAGWSEFTNIVEAQNIEPAEEDVTVSFGNDINEETNLSDNVVNNTYYNLNSSNGDGYDAIEQGIVLNSTTSADDLEVIAGLDINDEAVSANYHGLIIQVAAGSGTISVDVKTIGSHILNVKIGDGVPTQISKSERGTVDVPYNVSEPTYVYIYATSSGNSSAPIYRAPSAGANSVILYGYGIKLDDTTAIDTLNGEQEALTDDCKIFTLGGQQVNKLQPGMNIVRMKNGTVKKVMVK